MQDEGYVKYQCLHEKADWLSSELEVSQEILIKVNKLDLLRTELFDLDCIGLYPNGIGFGNVSIRYSSPLGELFIISATATGGARELGLDGYCLVTKADILANKIFCLGPLAASSESMTHAAIYQNSLKVNCVVHIHHKELFNILLAQKNILKTPKNIAYGTVEMANYLGNITKDYPLEACVVMEGHEEGIIFYGASIIQVRNQISFIYRMLEK